MIGFLLAFLITPFVPITAKMEISDIEMTHIEYQSIYEQPLGWELVYDEVLGKWRFNVRVR